MGTWSSACVRPHPRRGASCLPSKGTRARRAQHGGLPLRLASHRGAASWARRKRRPRPHPAAPPPKTVTPACRCVGASLTLATPRASSGVAPLLDTALTAVAFVSRKCSASDVVSRGRPRRNAQLATHVVGVRLTSDELALVRRAAGYEPLASWFRRMAVGAAREVGGQGQAADGTGARRAVADQQAVGLPGRARDDARRDRRAGAGARAGGRSVRRGKAEGR